MAFSGCGEKPRYVVPGAGAATCASYSKASGAAQPQKDAYLQWVMGYLVARQFSLNRPLSESKIGGSQWKATIAAWMDTWCSTRPQAQISDAAAALSDETLGR